MSFSEEKKVRQYCFLSQEAFAREPNVLFSPANRREGGREKPNLVAMKNLKEFCSSHDIDFNTLGVAWQ